MTSIKMILSTSAMQFWQLAKSFRSLIKKIEKIETFHKILKMLLEKRSVQSGQH